MGFFEGLITLFAVIVLAVCFFAFGFLAGTIFCIYFFEKNFPEAWSMIPLTSKKEPKEDFTEEDAKWTVS